MRDFTLRVYRSLLETFRKEDFQFCTFADYIRNPFSRCIILRHDVDKKPYNSLIFARIEAEMGIRGTYYFRIVPKSWDEQIVREIAAMGHEIGYHYEDLRLVRQKTKDQRKRTSDCPDVKSGSPLRFDKTARLQDKEKELAAAAIESFKYNLAKLRGIVPINTICMHGSPTSRWDSRLLWKYYDYKDYGIDGEPYFDINFNEVHYLTDTGRRWNGNAMSIRDKVPAGSRKSAPYIKYSHLHTTFDIVEAVKEKILSGTVLMTLHPQRWNDSSFPWMKEVIWQNVKNIVKYFIVRINNIWEYS